MMQFCELCHKIKTQQTHTYHDNHTTCLKCSQEYFYKTFEQYKGFGIKWNSQTKEPELISKGLKVHCPVCSVLCDAQMTRETLNKIPYDKNTLWNRMYNQAIDELLKMEKFSNDTSEYIIKCRISNAKYQIAAICKITQISIITSDNVQGLQELENWINIRTKNEYARSLQAYIIEMTSELCSLDYITAVVIKRRQEIKLQKEQEALLHQLSLELDIKIEEPQTPQFRILRDPRRQELPLLDVSQKRIKI